ncbi:MAG: PIG-L family deacetylase [Anaerolineae bacterium]|nr:PIG-L family deacetylase [Anaerolineae bacterium]
MAEPLKLMCVFAHPDDETLGTGGTLAKYAAEGVETHLVTATRGERGWHTAQDNPGLEALGKLREAELHAAARILGLKEVNFLDYIDGDLDKANPAEAIGKIVAHVRRVRPQVVITFSADGTYGHPDHIAISQFTTAAIVRAADAAYHDSAGQPPHTVSKLYYMVENQETIDQFIAAFGDIIMPVDGVNRSVIVWPDWAITTWLNTNEYAATVYQAILCHKTQFPSLRGVEQLSKERQQAILNAQTYYRAFSLVNGGRTVEHDLFEGLR